EFETGGEEATAAKSQSEISETEEELQAVVEEATDNKEPAEEAPSLEEQLVLAREEAGRNLENWQRAAAEMANFKRRQEEQMRLQRDRIKGEVLAGLISALDDMDLAFQNVPEEISGQLVGWVEGFRLVQRKLDKILDDQGVALIKTDGEFDPNLHEAVSHEDSDGHQEGQIIEELRKGYRIGQRVLRPALVRVAR
ncbi:MAG TPA: nucleotide exchange factor GrpE, partial [Anaerolineae bacterium]